MSAVEKITAQQKGLEGRPEWFVGEQLKRICQAEPESAALVEKDIDTITLKSVAGKIKAAADEIHRQQKGHCVVVPPEMAEQIVRKAYGLPEAAAPKEEQTQEPEQPAAAETDFLDLAAFL